MRKILFFILVFILNLFSTQINFEVKEESKISLAIYSKEGKLLRTLISGKKYQPGKYSIEWDGKDEEGKEVGKGEYIYKILYNPGIEVEYIMSVGNAGNPPYRTSDGKGSWGGVWGDVIDIAVDNSGVYLLWIQEEGEGCLVKVDENGKVIWKQHNSWEWGDCYGVASNGERVFVLNSQGIREGENKGARQAFIWRVDAKTGEYLFFPEIKYVKVGKPVKPQKILTFYEDIVESNFSLLPEISSFGIACDKDKIYVTLYNEDRIAVIDINSGKEVESIEGIKKPIGIEVYKENIYVVSEDKVLRIDKTTKEKKEIIKNLDTPYGIAIDENGNLYITQRGKSQNIVVYSQNGRFIRDIGKKGGREIEGKHIPENLRYPNGPGVGFGKIYVGESWPPRRIAVFTKEGKFLNEWIGPHYYSVSSCLDTYNLTDLYSCVDGHIYRFKVDLKNKKWYVDAIWPFYFWHGNPNRKFSPIAIGQPRPFVIEKESKKFLFLGGGVLPIYKIDGYKLIPITALNITSIWTDDKNGWIEFEHGQPWSWAKYKQISISQKFQNKTVAIWKNLNLDDSASIDELFPYNFTPTGGTYWAGWIMKNMDVYFLSTNGNLFYIPFSGFDEKGIPEYSWDKAKNIPIEVISYHSGLGVDEDGNFYISAIVDGPSKGIGWASNTKDAYLAKLNKEGKLIFKVGKKATSFAKPNEFYRCINIGGFIDDFVFVVDVNGQDRVYTKDGLYVDSLLKDTYRGPSPDAYTLWVEHFLSQEFKGTDGKNYLVAGSDAVHIYEIKGLEKIKKIEGNIKIE
jgi:DNA-binding beta-propeller fold protein YncE